MSEENRPSVLTGVASYIIVTEFCERLAYYGDYIFNNILRFFAYSYPFY